MDTKEIWQRINSHKGWYHQIDITPEVTTPGYNDSKGVLRLIGIPNNCSGLRAIDIGARDGYFSFELEKRGADVLAIDYVDPSKTGFNIAKELLGSNVAYFVDNIYNLDSSKYGDFDIVLFLGVLYHLRDPLLALDKIWGICRPNALVIVESHVIDNAFLDPESGSFSVLGNISPKLAIVPIMQFFPGNVLNKDYTNWWGPNMACLKAMLQMSNFRIEEQILNGGRGIFRARKNDDEKTNYYRNIEKGLVK